MTDTTFSEDPEEPAVPVEREPAPRSQRRRVPPVWLKDYETEQTIIRDETSLEEGVV